VFWVKKNWEYGATAGVQRIALEILLVGYQRPYPLEAVEGEATKNSESAQIDEACEKN